MALLLRLALASTLLPGCVTAQGADASKIAYGYFLCPPRNPFVVDDGCTTACCSGSNWDLTCMSFANTVALQAKGLKDPDLATGSRRPGETHGSAERAFASMTAAGRAHTDLGVPKDAVVFFAIAGYPPGHVAISSGILDNSGSPLIVTTGGRYHTGIRLEPLSKLAGRPAWHYLGWAAL